MAITQAKISAGIKSIGYRAVGGTGVYTDFGTKVFENTLNITSATVTRNDIRCETLDAALKSILTAGDTTVAFDIIDLDPTLLAELTGATKTEAGTGADKKTTLSLKSSAQYIYKDIQVEFDDGVDSITFPNVQLTYNLDGASLKTTPFKFHFEGLVLPDGKGKYIDVIVPTPAAAP